MKNNDEFDYNLFIKDVVEDMKKNPSDEAFLHVLAELIMRVNDEGTVPTPIQNEIRVVLFVDSDTEIDDVFPSDMEMGNRIVVLEYDNDGSRYLPLYTGREELKKLEGTNAVKDIPIRDIFEQVLDSNEFAGVIINPDTDCLFIYREAIEFILDNADGQFRHAC